MVRKGKFIIGKSKSGRLTLEQRLLGHNRQLTKLNTKVDLISAWISKKFGVSFLVEASARVKLVALSKHLSLVKSTARQSVNPGAKKAKQKSQSAAGEQESGFDVSAESDEMIVSDSDVDEADHDDDQTITVGEPVDGRTSLEDGEPERRRRIPRQRKRKILRNTMTRLQVGANNRDEGNVTEEQRPRRTLAKRNFQAPDKGRQKHSCNWPNCNKSFNYMSHLVTHKRTHTGVKPFKCTWPSCGKSFSSRTHLTTHRRTHTEEKPYVCDWPNCDKTFADRSNLNVHRRIHTGERPFKCEFCDYRCARSTDLTTHVRIHTGEKPYKCRVCPATFTQLSSKIKHEKNHH